jgi:hypothetical protein
MAEPVELRRALAAFLGGERFRKFVLEGACVGPQRLRAYHISANQLRSHRTWAGKPITVHSALYLTGGKTVAPMSWRGPKRLPQRSFIG